MTGHWLVSTRKGLFTVERNATGWAVTGVDFIGDNVTLTLTDPRDGRRYAALDHGHFGVKPHRSTATGWEEIATPAYPPKPDDVEENDMWGRPLPWSTARIWSLTAGGPNQPGTVWCGTMPWRPVPFNRSWRHLGARAGPVGPSEAAHVDGRRRRSAWPAFHLRGPAQPRANCHRCLHRRHLGFRGFRHHLVATRRRHARRARAARTRPRSDRAGRSLSDAKPLRAGSDVGTTS